MNMFKAFEERIAKAFGESSLGIVAPFSFKRLARQALRELERETYVVDGVNTAPALMTVLVSQDDDAIMRPLYGQLAQEIADLMEAEAARKDYVFVGKPLARFMVDSSLRHGRFAAFANNVDALTLEKLRDEERAFLSGFSAFGEDEVIVPIEEPVAPKPIDNVHVVEHSFSNDSSAGLDVLPASYVDEQLDISPIGAPSSLVDDALTLSDSLPEIDEVSEVFEMPEALDVPEVPEVPEVSEPEELESKSAQDDMTVPSHMLPEELTAADDAAGATIASDGEEPVSCLLIDRQSGRTYIGTAPETTIGRERTPGGIVLRDPNISRRHAKLVFEGSIWRIIDLDSTNGTLVNDIDIDTCALRDGDVLTLGLTNLEFRES